MFVAGLSEENGCDKCRLQVNKTPATPILLHHHTT
jgi:hypothetical protein